MFQTTNQDILGMFGNARSHDLYHQSFGVYWRLFLQASLRAMKQGLWATAWWQQQTVIYSIFTKSTQRWRFTALIKNVSLPLFFHSNWNCSSPAYGQNMSESHMCVCVQVWLKTALPEFPSIVVDCHLE